MTEDLIELWILMGGDFTFSEFLEIHEANKGRYTQPATGLRELFIQQQSGQNKGLQQGLGGPQGGIVGGIPGGLLG